MTDDSRVPMILDVDTGIDDAVALALATQTPAIDLVAVSTVAGNVDIEQTTENTLRVLDWLEAGEVPVCRGASRPLVREHVDAAFVHGTDGLGNAGIPASSRELAPERGPATIIRRANERRGELTGVFVGPLTNLAIALNVEPRLPELLKRVVIMGGAFWANGNVTPHAEFNIYVDPEAAAQVFRAPWRECLVVGLDVSEQTRLPQAIWRTLERDDSRARQLIYQVFQRSFMERQLPSVALHDPLALACALHGDLWTAEECTVEVELRGEERGRTIVRGSGDVQVVKEVDQERFWGMMEARLGLPRQAAEG